jgi:hypothetical protein
MLERPVCTASGKKPCGIMLGIVGRRGRMNVSGKQKIASYVKAMLDRRPAGIDKADRPMEAAVLLPLVEKDGKCGVLFEVRSR